MSIYFVDKTKLLEELIPVVESDPDMLNPSGTGGNDIRYICYIGANVDAVKDDVGLLLADIPVPAKVREYAATSMELKTRDEIFSAPWWFMDF